VTAQAADERQAIIAALDAELDRISNRLEDLHQQMMRMPTDERRTHWEEYYRLLGSLMQRQQEIENGRASVFDRNPDHRDGAGQQRVVSASRNAEGGARRR